MKSMHIRDFLRGEYKRINEPTLITKHGRPVATWMPFDGNVIPAQIVKKPKRHPVIIEDSSSG